MIDLDKLIPQDALGNISDELLAAYIDGNTTEAENAFIEQNSPAEELNTLSELLDDTHSFEDQISQWDGDYGFWELGIPPVIGSNDNNHLNNNSMNRNIYYASAQFGEHPLIDVSGEVFQWYNDTCAIRSQQLVLERFGIDVPQEVLIEIAENNGWYRVDGGTGTPMNCIGNLLEFYGVPSTSVVGANVGNLVAELAQGHQVIVGVDSGELHNSAIMESLKDLFVGDTPDHALIVAGIDLTDPNNAYVVLKDPGTGDVAKPYPLEQFMDAWRDSNCFMVSTDIPTPDFELQHSPLNNIGGVSMSEFLSSNNIHNYDHISVDLGDWYTHSEIEPILDTEPITEIDSALDEIYTSTDLEPYSDQNSFIHPDAEMDTETPSDMDDMEMDFENDIMETDL